ncbi:MAG: LegC family aminotransferase [Bacteriovoracaceae bacterium]|nr:LegC family aminotransferase [Bacteriovoracaceae bacterium]
MISTMFKDIIEFIKFLYPNQSTIPLHAPVFNGNEKKYLNDCIDSTFVSSVGSYVPKFEKMMSDYIGTKYAVATVNGTSALHLALKLLHVNSDSEVLTQALSFVATANAISYTGATPVFVDSSPSNLGMCPDALLKFLDENVILKEKIAINKVSRKKISACVPMHVFGHPVQMEKIAEICHKFHIPIIEDAAESLGSFFSKGRHTGTMGKLSIFSFNGNKIVTSGGGGMIVTDDEELFIRAKHLSTTAKVQHEWDFFHDEIGYNYRMPNINAALGMAQMESIDEKIRSKRATALEYKNFFQDKNIKFMDESEGRISNYWLNAIEFQSKEARDSFLIETNKAGIRTRPIWILMTDLPMYSSLPKTNITYATKYFNQIVNLPSSVRF